MRALKSLLALNGLVFLLRGGLNLTRPTSFYLAKGAPDNAMDAVRVLGITYVAFGLVQTGMWFTPDRIPVRVVAGSSMLFASGVALQALKQDAALPDSFHQIRRLSAAENVAVAALYAALLYREHDDRRQSVPAIACGA